LVITLSCDDKSVGTKIMKSVLFILFAFLLSFSLSANESLNEPILPIANDHNSDPELLSLGRELFNDKRLSKDGSISCASCHALNKGGADGRKMPMGIRQQLGTINTPTIFNSSLNFKQYWDGRAENLSDQIDGPIENPAEMASSWPAIITIINQDPHYRDKFLSSFEDGITIDNIKTAIVSFENSLVTPNSRFDLYLKGNNNFITPNELAGYNLFKNYGCISCHQGMAVGGNLFQKHGIMKDYFADRGNITEADYGRFNVTQQEADRFVFKVPSLRNVELTAPYFHDGSAETLDDAISTMMIYQLGVVAPLESDVQLIAAFLKTLTGEYQGERLWNTEK
jgi:cytochrome c peroxidase